VTSVKHVADIMNEITAASEEQSSGIQEVSQAITQMDEMTQQNAALVEQAAAAAESMQTQAGTLAHTVSVFKLHNAGNAPALSHSRPSAKKQVTAVASNLKPKAPRRVGRPASPEAAQLAPQRASRSPAGTGDDWEEF
jgi:hypothetical protein